MLFISNIDWYTSNQAIIEQPRVQNQIKNIICQKACYHYLVNSVIKTKNTLLVTRLIDSV